MVIDRRTFLQRSIAAAAGTFTLAGPFRGLVARAAAASPGIAANNAGYGPLVPVPDLRDGVVRLHLPEGFRYRSFSYTGEPMVDGVTTPGRHDGMAAYPGPSGTVRLVRNHEINGPGPAFGDPSRAYDPMARGGTTTVQLSEHAEKYRAWVSANGTMMNCAGGEMPYGTWVTCEETVNGPDVGPDFTGAPNDQLTEKHGYIFEVPSSDGPNQYEERNPVRSAGRFAHEAVALDPLTGFLYLTEDNFAFPSGYYRYRPPTNPMVTGRIADGGVLEMLRVVGKPRARLDHIEEIGRSFRVDWVPIPNPDPTFPEGTTNDEALVAVSNQGLEQGAAIFSRLEGLFYDEGVFYIVSTQGGRVDEGAPTSGFGRGLGQVWAYEPAREKLTLIFESPGPEVLELPDNIAVTPRDGILLCEDGPADNYLRGLTPDGDIFDFALNAIEGRRGDEFAGATFSPSGQTLYVNIQASSGLTFAIWGPWTNGPL